MHKLTQIPTVKVLLYTWVLSIVMLLGSCCNSIQHGTIIHKEMQSSGPSYGSLLLYKMTIDSSGETGIIMTTEEEYGEYKIGDKYPKQQ